VLLEQAGDVQPCFRRFNLRIRVHVDDRAQPP
jgi:hypothetical protein